MNISSNSINLKIREIRKRSKYIWMRFTWYIKKYRQQVALGLILLASLSYIFTGMAPRDFPVGTIVKIEEGSSITNVVEQFKEEGLVRSASVLKTLLIMRPGTEGVLAGDYYFSEEKDVFKIASIISRGDYGLSPFSITIPEGATVVEAALIYERILGGFNAEKFVEMALPFEGYLFPDTYFFLPNVSEKEIINVMKDNFVVRIDEIREEIDAFGKSIKDVVIMASLIEEEARIHKTRRMVAGVLWNRIDIGMRLQVDAVFPYIIGKNTFEVSLEDLAFDSPYNTYKYAGLPHGPISNPGLSSLKATVTPIPSDYLFYLSDYDGNMHYARTFEQHKVNKNKYLN